MVLAQLLVEDRRTPERIWSESLVSSRLLEYEVWVRLNAKGLVGSHGELAKQVLGRICFLELSPTVLARAIKPFDAVVRTLDALHLASVDFLRACWIPVTLATYDRAMHDLAAGMQIPLLEMA